MKNVLLSIVIPVYNVQKYLSGCLDSVIRQTYKNLEIICVDDGSTDDSGGILDEYAKKDTRIKVFHKSNSGLGSTRNYGIERSSGEYVAVLDSDDFISENYYEDLIKACDDDDVVMTTNIADYYENKKNKENAATGVVKDLSNIKDRKKLVVKSGMSVNKIYKKSFLLDNDIKFYPKSNLIEDNFFTVKVYLLANSIKVIDTSIYHYRRNPSSMSYKRLSEKDFICIDIAKRIYGYKNLRPEFTKVITKKISREIGTFYRKLPFGLKKEFKARFKAELPMIRIAVRKPLKYVFSKYADESFVYYSFFGESVVFKRKKFNSGGT